MYLKNDKRTSLVQIALIIIIFIINIILFSYNLSINTCLFIGIIESIIIFCGVRYRYIYTNKCISKEQYLNQNNYEKEEEKLDKLIKNENIEILANNKNEFMSKEIQNTKNIIIKKDINNKKNEVIKFISVLKKISLSNENNSINNEIHTNLCIQEKTEFVETINKEYILEQCYEEYINLRKIKIDRKNKMLSNRDYSKKKHDILSRLSDKVTDYNQRESILNELFKLNVIIKVDVTKYLKFYNWDKNIISQCKECNLIIKDSEINDYNTKNIVIKKDINNKKNEVIKFISVLKKISLSNENNFINSEIHTNLCIQEETEFVETINKEYVLEQCYEEYINLHKIKIDRKNKMLSNRDYSKKKHDILSRLSDKVTDYNQRESILNELFKLNVIIKVDVTKYLKFYNWDKNIISQCKECNLIIKDSEINDYNTKNNEIHTNLCIQEKTEFVETINKEYILEQCYEEYTNLYKIKIDRKNKMISNRDYSKKKHDILSRLSDKVTDYNQRESILNELFNLNLIIKVDVTKYLKFYNWDKNINSQCKECNLILKDSEVNDYNTKNVNVTEVFDNEFDKNDNNIKKETQNTKNTIIEKDINNKKKNEVIKFISVLKKISLSNENKIIEASENIGIEILINTDSSSSYIIKKNKESDKNTIALNNNDLIIISNGINSEVIDKDDYIYNLKSNNIDEELDDTEKNDIEQINQAEFLLEDISDNVANISTEIKYSSRDNFAEFIIDDVQHENVTQPIILKESQKKEMPYSLFEDMRKIGGKIRYNSYYGEGSAKRFYKQAKFMKDFIDDYNEDIEFKWYNPDYMAMNNQQLRCYFSWRSKVRSGVVKSTSLSYVYVYIYELLNKVGITKSRDGLEKLLFIWSEYRKHNNHLDKYLPNWIKDYYICNNIKLNYDELIKLYPIKIDNNIKKLELLNKNYNEKLEYLDSCSSYKILKSRFYKSEYGYTLNRCLPIVFTAVEQYFLENEIDFTQIILGKLTRDRWTSSFDRAVYYHRKSKLNKIVIISSTERYICQNGEWEYERVENHNRSRNLIGFILKSMEERLRELLAFKSKLQPNIYTVKADFYNNAKLLSTISNEKFTQIISSAVEEYFSTSGIEKFIFYKQKNGIDNQKQIEKFDDSQKKTRNFEIDVSKLDSIRKTVDELQEKLIVDDDIQHKNAIKNDFIKRSSITIKSKQLVDNIKNTIKPIEINIDVSKLDSIRKTADELQEKLIVDDSIQYKNAIENDFVKQSSITIENKQLVDNTKNSDNSMNINIDLSQFNKIRESSNKLQERLVIGDNSNFENNIVEELLEETIVKVRREQRIEYFEKNEWHIMLGMLTTVEVSVLKILIEKINVIDKLINISHEYNILPEVILEGINEKALECVDDNILETNENPPYIYEDYFEEIENMVKGEI